MNPTPQAPALTALTKEDEELVSRVERKEPFDTTGQRLCAIIRRLVAQLADRDAVVRAARKAVFTDHPKYDWTIDAEDAERLFDALAALDRRENGQGT